jgi:hypothetical protein
MFFEPWRRGAVDISSALGTEDPCSNPTWGIRFLGKHSSDVVDLIFLVCVLEKRNKGFGPKVFEK